MTRDTEMLIGVAFAAMMFSTSLLLIVLTGGLVVELINDNPPISECLCEH